MGRDVVTPNEAALLHSSLERAQENVERENAKTMGDQPYGFSSYVRKAFDQKRVHNPSAILNFYDNPNRLE